MDLGTGDGRFVLHAARSCPDSLVVGIDADASSMVRSSRKASVEGVENAVFVVAAAESLPRELDGRADEVRIQFPWGSLLRGLVDVDDAIIAPMVRLCAPGASITALISVVERDHAGAAFDPAVAGPMFRRSGLELVEARYASAAEIGSSRSSWARRLGAGERRPVTLVRLVRTGPMRGPSGPC